MMGWGWGGVGVGSGWGGMLTFVYQYMLRHVDDVTLTMGRSGG